MENGRFWRMGWALVAFCCLAGWAAGQAAGTDAGRWVAYVDSIGKLDAQAWVNDVQDMDTLLKDVQDLSVQISKEDWAELLESYKTGRMYRESAERIFPAAAIEDVDLSAVDPDSVKVTWLTVPSKTATGKMDLLLVNHTEIDWEADVYFVKDGCLLGRHHAYHKYGLEANSGSGGMAIAYHNECLESGTGVWEHVNCLFTEEDQHLVPMGWVFKEVNLANPGVRNRGLKGRIVSYSPLTVQYDWEAEVGYRYQGSQPRFRGKSTVVYNWDAEEKRLVAVFKSGNLNEEKLLSFDLGAPEELFIHAWGKELIADLNGKNENRRLAVMEYLESVRQ
jgi:hypothetical protein